MVMGISFSLQERLKVMGISCPLPERLKVMGLDVAYFQLVPPDLATLMSVTTADGNSAS